MRPSGKVLRAAARCQRFTSTRIAPVTRAVRQALAFSALALAATSPALACDNPAPDPGDIVTCSDPVYNDTIDYAVYDLTVIIDSGTTVDPPAGDNGV
jgi:hypothetical protein